MNHQNFDYKRFTVLLRKDLEENKSVYLLMFGLFFVAYSFIICNSSISIYAEANALLSSSPEDFFARYDVPHGTDCNWKKIVSTTSGFFFLFMISSNILARESMQSRDAFPHPLLLPVSGFEMFVRQWLYSVPFSLIAFTVMVWSADFVRILICNIAFPEWDFAHPLYKAQDLYTPESGLIFRILFTITLLGQAFSACMATCKSRRKRTWGQLPLLAVPVIMSIITFAIDSHEPGSRELQQAEFIWQTGVVALTVLLWYISYRRGFKADLEYYPPETNSQ